MKVLAKNPLPTLDEVSSALAAPVPPVKVSLSRRGVLTTLIVVLIAVAAWFYFTNLFTYRSGIALPQMSKAPAPPPDAKGTEPVFIPADAQTQPRQQPEIHLPVIEIENETDTSKRITDTAKEDHPEDPRLAGAVTNTATTAAKTRRLRPQKNTPRHAVQISPAPVPPVQAVIAATQPGQRPRTFEPASSGMPQKNSGPTPVISDNTNPQLNDVSELPLSGGVSIRGLRTTITPYPETASDLDEPPVDFASISAIAPPPKPPIKKAARQISGLVVIVNKANSKRFARSDISNIYRDRITRWPSGERILVLNLPLDSGERHRFTSEILEMSPLDAATESSNRTITNRAQNEYRTKNAEVVVSYIERHENAIGYVPATAITDNNNVRVVYSIP